MTINLDKGSSKMRTGNDSSSGMAVYSKQLTKELEQKYKDIPKYIKQCLKEMGLD